MKKYLSWRITGSILGLTALVVTGCGMSNLKVQEGSSVVINYSLEADGKVVVPEQRPETMEVVIGQSGLPKAYEEALKGLKVGSKKVITLSPEEAYGPVRQELLMRVPKEQVPPNLKEGSMIGGTNKDGRRINMRVAKVLDDSVIIDQNHPLAGRTLTYHVEIKSIS